LWKTVVSEIKHEVPLVSPNSIAQAPFSSNRS
jgi:hypothetical protein